MKKALFLLGFAFLISTSCAPKTPEFVYKLTNEQLSNLMLDMQLTDVALGEVNGLERDSLQVAFRTSLEEVYGLPILVLANEIKNLESDPEKLLLVMNRVQILLDSIR